MDLDVAQLDLRHSWYLEEGDARIIPSLLMGSQFGSRQWPEQSRSAKKLASLQF